MAPFELDDVDRGILHMLQRDARNNSATDIAAEVGVAPNTVRNRIERLEEHGVVQGFHPHIDYERAGYQLRVIFVGTVPIASRAETAAAVLEIEGVVAVTETLSGHENLIVESVGENSDELTAVASRIKNLGVNILDEWFTKNTRVKPFDNFGLEIIEEE